MSKTIYSSTKDAGFTLMEFILVVAIVSTIGILSTGFFSSFLLQNTVSNTQDQVVEQLRKAQIYSMSGKKNSMWGVHFQNNKIILFKGSAFLTRDVNFDEEFPISSNIQITNLNNVVFAKTTGLPNSTPEINIVGGGKTKKVTVNAQGVASR